MFEGRQNETNCIKLHDFLRWLLASDLKYLLNLKTAGLGDLFRESVLSGVERPTYEPRHEKTCLRGLRPGRTHTGLRSHRS